MSLTDMLDKAKFPEPISFRWRDFSEGRTMKIYAALASGEDKGVVIAVNERDPKMQIFVLTTFKGEDW